MIEKINLKPDYTCGQEFATFFREDIPSCLRAVADYLEQNDLEVAIDLIDSILIDGDHSTRQYSATFPCDWFEKYN